MGGSSGSLYANWLQISRTPTHLHALFLLRRPISGTTRALTAIVSSQIRILLSAVPRYVCHVYVYVHIYVCMHNRYVYDRYMRTHVCMYNACGYVHTYVFAYMHTYRSCSC
jgi:hypothetical protein